MRKQFVLTLTGPDRIGFVERVTGLLLERAGNVETSRMARLGGEFAMLALVSMPAERFATLERELADLVGGGHKLTISPVQEPPAHGFPGWKSRTIRVQGADHEGIIHHVARYLSDQGITIESADSEATAGSTSGTPLFSMIARVLVPPGMTGTGWEAGLGEIGDQLNVDIQVTSTDEA